MTQDMNHTFVKALRAVFVTTMMLLTSGNGLAQVKVIGNVYGGGNKAPVGKAVTVNVKAGQIGDTQIDANHGNVYGGGALAQTNTDAPNEYYAVTLAAGTSLLGYYSKSGDNYTPYTTEVAVANTTYYQKNETVVNLIGGTVKGEVYGGGHGDVSHEADVNGDVTVNIGSGTVDATTGLATSTSGSVTIKGSVFGCNNVNGTPKKDVFVNVYQTAHTTANTCPDITTLEDLETAVASNSADKFALVAVYGGGNKAAYAPTAVESPGTPHSATVHVYTCANTVQTVYGGGNAADATKVKVVIDGGYFDQVFGGGNGYSATGNHTDATAANYNPGANISVSATTEIHGGLFNQIFGGSNQYGNVASSSLDIDSESGCPELIYEMFGGANEAVINGDVTTTLTCSDNKIGSFYGGSNLADISGNVTLNVEGGEYINVFGGSKGRAAKAAVGEEGQDGYQPAVDAKPANIGGNITLNLYGGTITNAFGGSDVNGNIDGIITVNMLDKGATGCGLTVHNIYGGGRDAAYTPTYTVGEGETRISPVVNLIHGTVSKKDDDTGGNVFGGGYGSTATVTSSPKVNVGYATTMTLPTGFTLTNAQVTVAGDVYGGGEEASVSGNTSVIVQKATIDGKTISTAVTGNVFGGGKAADVTGAPTVNINGGTVGTGVYGGCNTSGRVGGNIIVNLTGGQVGTDVKTADVYGGGFGGDSDLTDEDLEGTYTSGNITVTLSGTTVYGDLYGGSAFGSVNGTSSKTTVNLQNDNLHGKVFGGGKGQLVATTPVVLSEYTAITNGAVEVNITAENTNGNLIGVYGGANVKGNVVGNIVVNVLANVGATGANNSRDIFGGGLGAATATNGNVTVNIGDLTLDNSSTPAPIYNPVVYGAVYGGSALGSVNDTEADKTIVNILSGTVHGNIYGGGLGESGTANVAKGQVNGTVIVNIGTTDDETTPTYTGYATIDGSIYGCNNTNGSPKGDVTVNIYKTAHTTDNSVPATQTDGWTAAELATNSASQEYAIAAVYGGGNLAAYLPAANKSTTVHVYTCYNTIQYVYGGGNAADVGTSEVNANTNVIIDGGRFYYVFGGGNGYSSTGNHNDPSAVDYNPGANINGTASTTLYGGVIDKVFGGGNQYGDIKTTNFVLGSRNSCDMFYGEVFGGGNEAPINGDLITTIQCGAGDFGDFYGGANQANITGDVTLNVYGGNFTSVFGGSKGVSGTPANITGAVTLNLYGGTMTNAFGGSDVNGNITGKITVNLEDAEDTTCPLVVHNVYGGGRDATYTPSQVEGAVISSPEVNLIKGTVSKSGVDYGNVFGGGLGSTATVTANPVVKLQGGTVEGTIFGGGSAAPVVGNPTVYAYDGSVPTIHGGGLGSSAVVTGDPSVVVNKTADKDLTVTSVYGGGDAAGVTGNTTVTLTAGSLTNAFGGGNVADITGTTSVTLQGATVDNIFGGGNAANVSSTSTVIVSSGNATTGVYGGCNTTGTVGSASVTLTGGTVGTDWGTSEPTTIDAMPKLVFGGGYGEETGVTGNVVVEVGSDGQTSGGATIWGDVYGGSAMGKVNGTAVTSDYSTAVTLNFGTVKGSIFGGGYGLNDKAANVYGPVTVTVNKGTAKNVFGANNLSGAPQSTVAVTINNTTSAISNVFGGGNQAAFTGTPDVNINGGTISNVYGGGNEAGVGGGDVAISDGSITGGVYGGCNTSGTVSGNIAVNLTGGTIGAVSGTTDIVFGGGYGESTATTGNVTVTVNGSIIYGNIYGGSALGSVNDALADLTKIDITSGTINGNIYGGGLGQAGTSNAAKGQVNGTVTVNIGATDGAATPTYSGSATINGSVYGCNNTNGSPQGDVNVNIYKTAAPITTGGYAIANVFGGGNNAHYTPTGTTATAQVHIYTCENSVQNVYGGGNAADATNVGVIIDGGRFDLIFGGGNGAGEGNPGANITGNAITQIHGGTFNQVFGGSNSKGDVVNASLTLDNTSGCDLEISELFGGANEADITGNVETTLACSTETSSFIIGSFYGGSNKANITGNVTLNVYGGTYENVFGGSKGVSGGKAANIMDNPATTDITEGNVTLNLYGGTIENAFGGSNLNGNIEGVITVNMLNLGGECPLSVKNIYGASNQTAYTPTFTPASGTERISPIVNLIHGTVSKKEETNGGTTTYSGGNVFGGAYGENATVTSNPKVNIGYDATTMSGAIPTTLPSGYTPPTSYTVSVAGNVYGGGDMAQVAGSTTIIQNANSSVTSLFGGGNAASVGNATVNVNGGSVTTGVYGGCNTSGTVGGEIYSYEYNSTEGTNTKATSATNYDGTIAVNISSNLGVSGTPLTEGIYGGGMGSATQTTGTVTVTIDKPSGEGASAPVIYSDIYGGSALGQVAASNKLTKVDFKNGELHGVIYGGGMGDDTNAAVVAGPTEVAVSNGTITGGIYGGCNVNGMVNGSATVGITGGTVGTSGNTSGIVYGGGLGESTNVVGSVAVTISETTTTTIHGDVYGGSAKGLVNCTLNESTPSLTANAKTDVTLNGGTINGNLYGGGHGIGGASANVWGPVTVEVKGGSVSTYNVGETTYGGSVFGCNNLSGAPQNTVQVNIEKTADAMSVTNVYGGGNQAPYSYTTGNYPEVNIKNGTVSSNVFGGGLGSTAIVTGNPKVTIGDATAEYAAIVGNAYGGGDAAKVVGNTTVIYNDENASSQVANLFGGSNAANIEVNSQISGTGKTNVTLTNGKVTTGVYGGCNTSGTVDEAIVTLNGGTMLDVYGSGKGHGTTTNTANVFVGKYENSAYTGSATINGDVYGGSEEGAAGTTIVNLNSVTTLAGHVFGGGKGSGTEETTRATVTNKATVNQNGITMAAGKNIYGGCNVNGTAAATYVYIMDGTSNSVFGGGLGPNTGVTGNVLVSIGKDADGTLSSATALIVSDNVYGGSAQGTVNTANASPLNTTTVNLWAGTINGDVYGGGLGDGTNPAAVNGIAKVNLNGYDNNGTPTIEGNCVVKGSIFGGNDTNGSPAATEVHIYKTVGYTGHQRTSTPSTAAAATYELAAVYGGGDNAAFTGSTTKVVIETCDPSIETVYGGGNAADATNTRVEVKGAYEIGTVFGGGNGQTTAANVPGTATTVLNGGRIHDFYGGSNLHGDIGSIVEGKATGGTDITIDDLYTKNTTGCLLKVDNIYGAGNLADVKGGVKMTMGCLSSDDTIDYLYGGAKNANINGDVVLTVTSGKFTNVFGGNDAGGTIGGSITVNVEETGCKPLIIENVYGGGNLAPYKGSPTVNLRSFTSIGNVYGGGYGAAAIVTGNPIVNINQVFGAFTTETLGTIGNVYGGGYGADVDGDVEVNIAKDPTVTFETGTQKGNAQDVVGANITGSVYGGGFGETTNVTGDVVVNVGRTGAPDAVKEKITIGQDVYGGSALGKVNKPSSGETTDKTTKVNLYAGKITRNVYGGGEGKLAEGDNPAKQAEVWGDAVVTMYGDMITGALYGGCNLNGALKKTSTVTVLGGTLGTAYGDTPPATIPNILFGGGKGASTSVDGKTTVNIGTKTLKTAATETSPAVYEYAGTANIYGNVYGGSENGTVGEVDVNLFANTIYGNVFGGGYSTDANATAATDVNVTLDGTKFECIYSGSDENAVPLTGQIFGCNNLVGSPKGHVKVHVLKTVNLDAEKEALKNNSNAALADRKNYDVAAIYGGGNQADYIPTLALSTNATEKEQAYAEVIIEGCEKTSIESVYGGGNAAAVPATKVTVNGSYIINRLYGGGNGAGTNNNGANVGYYAYDNTKTYGTGKAETRLLGGYINSVFGGSNTKGDIIGGTDVKTKKEGDPELKPTGDCCTTLNIGELYGAGSHAEMNGDVNIIVECMPDDYVDAVYGGAEEAIINGNVYLTVTSGKFGRVFGGNNKGGSINGAITVNVVEDGCKDLEIGELYGAGNAAPYSIYGYTYNEETKKWEERENKADNIPQNLKEFLATNPNHPYPVNVLVESCTSIGKIYGGGYGSAATVTGDTYVNINMLYGHVNNEAKTKLGHIGQVFGGGSAADVKGNTTVDIGTATSNENIGVIITNDNYINPDPADYVTTPYIPLTAAVYGGGEKAKVDGSTTINIGTVDQSLGVTIDGNIYGGGKEGDITGNTQVNICAVNSDDPNTTDVVEFTPVTFAAGNPGVTITGDVFGAGQGITTNFNKALLSGNSTIIMGGGSVKKSVYGGGELSQVGGNTDITVMGGTIGTANLGEATYGNVYGGGLGSTSDVRFGLIKGNTNVTIANSTVGENTITPTILHNIYGGGAYGSVGTYIYESDNVDAEIVSLQTATTGTATATTGTATITITGGIIGTNGKENGMIFGSSRGDVDAPGSIQDKLAWVNNTIVTIGTSGATTGPQINGSVYGSGENGHTLNNAVVTVHSGTIGIASGDDVVVTNKDNTTTTYKAYNYPYRGNVYGGGCGTDMYDSNNDGTDDTYNPLAGIVQGTASVTITGGQVVHNVYGAGAMGSVGKTDNTGAITSGGKTTIEISGGIVGVENTDAEGGNVFGAARGDADAPNGLAQVIETEVRIKPNTIDNKPQANIMGSVYGGGALGDVGTYTTLADGTNTYPEGSGACVVTVTGGEIHHNVFGAGKGVANTFTCQKAMVNSTAVTITNGTVDGSVYGGGEVGRVENNTVVKIGDGDGVGAGTDPTSAPEIKGNVFGAGAGLETHGYSALVRGNSTVTVEGNANVGESVYGGGEIAAVGRYALDDAGMPSGLVSGGECKVTVKGHAVIAKDVFGAGEGVDESKKTYTYADDANRPKRMNNSNDWEYFATRPKYLAFLQTLALATDTKLSIEGNAKVNGSVYGGSESGFVQRDTEVKIQNGTIGTATTGGNVFGGGKGLSTFAEAGRVSGNVLLATNGGTIWGNVFGGGELGIVKGGVVVNVLDGELKKDVYGGGALANTNTGNWDGTTLSATTYSEVTGLTAGTSSVVGYYTKSDDKYTPATGTAASGTKYYASSSTTVNLLGGTINGDAYGGGLGQKTGFNGAKSDIAALVYGDVNVNLGSEGGSSATAFNITHFTGDHADVIKSGRVFGCNNLNGSPQGDVTVKAWKTVTGKLDGNTNTRTAEGKKKLKEGDDGYMAHTYEVAAIYGGGNLANYAPTATGAKASVIIETCDVSAERVYGGGNAAEVPRTDVLVNGAYEIAEVFGGGNGNDPYTTDGGTTWVDNPGANVNGNANTLLQGGLIHAAYGGSNKKGTITGNVTIDIGPEGACDLDLEKMVGAGKDADVNGDLIMVLGCKPNTKIPLVYGGADNAHVNGDVELTITSGKFGQVFGGNNKGGFILGHIKLNIEETGNCAVPIEIDELYLGGNEAEYSMYGYYQDGTDVNGKPIYKSRTAEMAAITDPNATGYTPAVTSISGMDVRKTAPYAQPVLNLISCTRIGRVFGGGYGEGATLYGDPIVNINMIPGAHAKDIKRNGSANEHDLGEIGGKYTNAKGEVVDGGVFGGGDGAAVYGNTTINIGTASTVTMTSVDDNDETTEVDEKHPNVEGAYIVGNIYGGGNLANVGDYHLETVDGNTVDKIDVVGNTFVNIGAVKGNPVLGTDNKPTGEYNYTPVTITGDGYEGVKILGHVFGGGKGEAIASGEGAFRCGKAMVTGGTNVCIGNGTVTGFVYGGGEVGRVEENTRVTIGLGNGDANKTSAPVIGGDVFGAGKGEKTHGYSALVRGNTYVTIQGDAKLRKSVYGGGEIASVGRYNVANAAYHAEHPEVGVGMPYSLANENSGNCFVVVRGNAEIGPDTPMKMTADGGPDDTGHVFGAGKGVLPYEGYSSTETPWRIKPGDSKDEYNAATYGDDVEAEYLKYIETLALATQTDVTIGGNAFVKGSVYGGSENGHVQHNTHVTIAGGQIGSGDGVNRRYTTDEWASASLAECAHWTYDPNDAAPWDPYATYKNPADGKYYYDAAFKQTAEGGYYIAKDGHTFYGNVFGGGSGLVPYAPGKWHRAAGSVGGNTVVDITGGHILTSVYGGNEQTDVGTYKKDEHDALVVPVRDGKCTINMTGGTVGVPRTEQEMKDHPLTCYVFGAGKGDQRIFFNTWTNVINTEVNITGDARIYGSTFGGGEDGHVINNAVTNIGGNVTIGETPHTHTNVIIGTTGTSYVDGNIFGGGRGFSGEAQTAGTVGGNVDVNISSGKILGSVYGGGRLASVGTQFTAPDDPNYGTFLEDGTGENAKTYGHVTINISGGTIGNGTGNNVSGDVSGNVFGGSMGRLALLNGTTNPIWPKMAQVKSTTVKVSGNALIKRNVFGGGELGTVRDNAIVNITGGQVNRDVYGGGYGSQDFTTKTTIEVKEPKPDVTNPTSDADYNINYYTFTPMQWAGCVGKSTTVNISGGLVRKSVYGGGEMASVGIIDSSSDADGNLKNYVRHDDENNGFALSWPYEFKYTPGYEGATHVNITGGRIGVTKDDDDINTDNGDVYGGGKGIAGDYKDYIYCANVGSSEVTINYTSSATTEDPTKYLEGGDCITGAVYGGAENGHVMGDTKLTLVKGLVGHSIYGGGSGKGQFTKTLDKITGVEVVTNNTPTPAATKPNQTTDKYDATIYSITAGKVFGNTEIEMTGGYVVRNVYGGGNLGSVGKGNYAGGADDYSTAGYGEKLSGNLWDGVSKESQAFLNSGKCTVKITGGNVGYIDFAKVSDYTYSGLPYGNVFGGCRGESAPNIGESPRYLYCPTFFSGYANETDVTIGTAGSSTGPKIWGSVYGGGMDGHVRRDAIVTINSGEIGRALTGDVSAADLAKVEWSQCGNVYGAGSGIGQYKYDFNYDGDYEDVVEYTNPQTGRTSTVNEKDFSTSAGSVTRFTKVDIKGGTIHRNVYGGGSLSSIGGPKIPPITIDPYRKGDTADGHGAGKQSFNEVIITGGTIGDATSFANGYGGYVFGASRGDETITNPSSFANSVWTDVKVQGGTIAGDVYGGGEVGSVRQGTEVALTGGIVNHDVFGGGKGTSTVAADIGGDVLVDLNNVAEDTKGAVVKGNVFGANNVNGTPKGHVKVHVHATQNENTEAINVKVNDQFDVTGVYGGGKQADYVPADTETKQSTEVIIEGCDLTSIQEVYGGGYGAAVPGTDVLIKGTKIIDNVFGGGYGKSTDDFPDNPGANVGYLSDGTTVYGGQYGGKAIVELMAGHVNNVYGGSNTKGDIRGGSSMTTVDNDGDAGTCKNLDVGELYGGGKEAPMEGGAEIVLGCMPDDWIGEIYAGARQANVGNDVSLTITSGKFGRVYGGNRDSGQIDGYVEVNIEECPTCNVPVVIGELYGGGNNAAYTLPDAYLKDYPDYSSPRVNVRSFTSIGTIYGGGYGPSATVKGNPTVNINVGMVEGGGKAYNGEDKELSDNTMVKLWPHEMNKIGVIGNVFGGGNAAKVEGNTYVNIGTAEYEKLDRIIPGETSVGNYYIRTGSSPNYVYTKVPPKYAEEGKTYYERHDAVYTEITGVTVGTTDVSTYYTRSGEGTTESPYVFTPVCVAEADTVYCQPVLGADIRGDVYGGGNKAEVTGETNVKIGKE